MELKKGSLELTFSFLFLYEFYNSGGVKKAQLI